MLGPVLVIAATVVCVSACTFTGHVNMTSEKLMVTCECDTSRHSPLDVARVEQVTIREETHHKRYSFLARVHKGESETDKYRQNYAVAESWISDDLDIAILTLAFDPDRKLDFTCIIIGFDGLDVLKVVQLSLAYDPSDYHNAMAVTTTTATTATTSPVTVTVDQEEQPLVEQQAAAVETKLSRGTMTTIIIASLLMIIVGLIAFIIARRKRVRPEVSVYPPLTSSNTVPLDVVVHLLQGLKSLNANGSNDVTSTCRSFSPCSSTLLSGSYDLWDTSASPVPETTQYSDTSQDVSDSL